ncbi:multidrug resistance protein, MATE family [Fistulifera solaris]|uniref:Multidrug resistance protein, MATE family n=1 Tax=Fistulifera solaris TaxID=1519565 RepID=A0A1Z5J9M8_FISSO|nr:multidrug resistance protein, MATE family [Fistulifera solaris]|eukprot:GAX10697.1 multidrug resistance protein, MATE family [Fistulifera solaris]
MIRNEASEVTPLAKQRKNKVFREEEHISRQLALEETKNLIQLAVPTVGIQIGAVVPPLLLTSYIGRTYGSVRLDGFLLASLTGNLFTLALLQGLFSASDTLSPQAFGANNEREVGLLAMRGFLGSMMVMIPVNAVLVTHMGPILEFVGIDPEVSHNAWQWYRIYILSLPFYALFQVTWKFLSAQSVLFPCVVAVGVSSLLVLPVALVVWTHFCGYLGTAWALVTYQVIEPLLLLLYIWWKQPHRPETWPGLASWNEALEERRFWSYIALGAGGILASSEWIYWESLTLMIGTIGVEALSIHAIPSYVVMVIFMFPLGLGIALAIRMGHTLPHSVSRTRELAFGCWCINAVLSGVVAIMLHVTRHHLYRIFTNDPIIQQGADEIWPHVCIFQFGLSIFAINMGLTTGLGMQWTLGLVTILFLWVLGLPSAYYFAITRRGGLLAAWRCVWPPYLAINFVLMLAVWCKDWEEIAKQIRAREELTGNSPLTPPKQLHKRTLDQYYGATCER